MVRVFEKDFQKNFDKKLPAKISDVQIDALFAVLDLDGNGQLDHDEIIGVLEERQGLGQGHEDDLKNAMTDQFSRILSMIRQRTGL